MPEQVDLRVPATEATDVRVLLRVHDAYLRLAVESVLDSAGIGLARADDGEAHVVTDDVRHHSARTILIVDESSAQSQTAVEALVQGEIAGVVSRREPEQLPLVLRSATVHLAAIPHAVLDVVKRAPKLGERQVRILEMVTQGMSNSRIAERLHVSDATIKREVSNLLRAFDCSSRLELAMKSTRSGSLGAS